jgi:hypothetical protein
MKFPVTLQNEDEKSQQGPPEDAAVVTTRTGLLIEQLITGIQADIAEAVEQLEGGLATIRALETHTKGVNGLASVLRSKGIAIEQIIDVLRGEADDVARKMQGTPREPIVENVNVAHLERVAEVLKAG